jgi:hypothetical protein
MVSASDSDQPAAPVTPNALLAARRRAAFVADRQRRDGPERPVARERGSGSALPRLLRRERVAEPFVRDGLHPPVGVATRARGRLAATPQRPVGSPGMGRVHCPNRRVRRSHQAPQTRGPRTEPDRPVETRRASSRFIAHPRLQSPQTSPRFREQLDTATPNQKAKKRGPSCPDRNHRALFSTALSATWRHTATRGPRKTSLPVSPCSIG